MSPFDPAEVTGTPHGAPLVPDLPLRLRRTEILTVVWRTDPQAAGALIPVPLELASDVCAVHVYRMHDAEWFGVYGESAVHLPVRLPDGRPAVYSPFLVLESDAAVAAGREAYGQPKKMGEVALGPVGDLLVGRVRRNRIEVVTATMCWKQRRAPADALEAVLPGAATNVNLRVLPADGRDLRRELVVRTFEDVEVHEAWTGPATVELRRNAQVPIHRLEVREELFGLHRVIDLTLPPARVVHRYP